jgi:uncharacterized protein (TIGR02271 family)
MVLHKLEDFDSEYLTTVEEKDIKGLGVYVEGTDEKIGSVHDALVDENGRFRYLVVDVGFWIFGKKVLLPIGRSRIDYYSDRVYAIGLTKQQVEELPEFHEHLVTDYDYEEEVREVYRQSDLMTSPVETSTSIESAVPVETSGMLESSKLLESPEISSLTTSKPTHTHDTYRYEHEPDLFALNESDHQIFKLYEERLIANKHRQKIGEVSVSKHVEIENTRVAVPLEKEHIVIEHFIPKDSNQAIVANADFHEGEVTHMEIYGETPDVHKETFVREEIRVKKIVEKDIVETQDTLRREELNVKAPNVSVEER